MKQNMFTRVKSFFSGVNQMQDISHLLVGDVGENITVSEYKTKQAQLMANVGWVYAANQVIADDCSAVRLKLMHVMKDGDEEEVYSHEILDLLDDPNNVITAKQLWNLYYSYLNLTGEAYILKLDQKGNALEDKHKLPSALFPLPSHLCEFHVGEKSWDESYVMFNGERYPINAVLRDINPDPENIYNGMSIVRKASLTVDTDIQMKRWNNKLFKNGARPGVVVEVPDQLKDDAYKRLKQQFDEQYRGVGNAFNRVILEGGAKMSPFMMTTQDLDFLESKRFTRDEILAMFKVSGSNLGITEDVNRANAEAQEYSYAKRCIKPRLEQFVDFINKRLLRPIYNGEYKLDFEDPIPENTEMRLREAEAGVNKWLTINEVRDMYGREALENGNGDQLYVPISNVPIEDLEYLSDTATEPTPTEEPANGEKSHPKAIENRTEIGEAKVKDYSLKAIKYERMIMRASRRMFNAQAQDVKDWLRDNADKLNKSFVKKKDWAFSMVDWEEYNRSFSAELEKIFAIIIEEIGTQAFNALVEGEFDPYTQTIQNYIKNNSLKVAKSINEETEKQIRATLAQGMRENDTMQELTARIMHVFGTASTYRAFMIARTESITTENYADVQAWEQTGEVEYKEWYTAGDEKVCGFCNEMDGVTVKLDKLFFNKGDTMTFLDSNGHEHTMTLDYRSIGEPSLHPNCRCTLLPILKD